MLIPETVISTPTTETSTGSSESVGESLTPATTPAGTEGSTEVAKVEPAKVVSKADTKAIGALGSATENPYTPNYKYKVKDKELEMPDWAKAAVKNKAAEDSVRDLLTKADGIEEIKKERDEIKTNFSKLEPEFKQLTQSLDVLSQYVSQGDFGKFFQALRIPEKAFLEYAVERLQYHNLPPEQRQQIDTRNQEQARLESLSHQNETYEERFNRQAVENRELQFSIAAMKPEVSQFVSAFEAAAGMPGAFRQKVIEQGILAAQFGKDLSAEEAIAAVMKTFGGFIKPPVAAVANPGVQVSADGKPVVTTPKPVIPNINSSAGSGSPVKRTFKSLAEIRALTNK